MKKVITIALIATFLTSCVSSNYQSCAAYASVEVKNDIK